MQNILERMRGQNPVILYLGLGGASVLLLIAAIIGALQTGGDQVTTTLDPGAAVAPGAEGGETPGEVLSPEAAPEAAKTGGAAAKGTVPRTGIASKDLVSEIGATRIGVTPTEIRWGLHAPKTFDGVPLPLADAPLKGVGIYLEAINQSKVNGRVVKQYFSDDRYTVPGARSSCDFILTDSKVFFASGTLGVDQVATVAACSAKTVPPTPYMAAGGSEEAFKSINMYQVAGSYDTHLIMLADFLAKEVKKDPCLNPSSCAANQSIYSGMTRIAAVELDSKYIEGSVESLRKRIESVGLTWVGKVKVPKYTDSSNTHVYTAQCLQLGSLNAQIVVPATDPLTTSNMTVTGECARFKWTMSNFAHDSDTALKLMGGTWIGARGLAGGCYYNAWNTPTGQSKCGQLKRAHDDWVKVNGEDDWNKDGQGGISGYQLTHVWLGALKAAGNDLTRERFLAALAVYDNYNDLVTSPLTYLNSPNISHGIDRMAIYEAVSAGSDQLKWRMISDGLIGSF